MEEKSCKNCKYYVPHYVKHSTFFLEVDGHCRNQKLRRCNSKVSWALRENCKHWEQKEEKKEERRKAITETLQSMEKSLREIKAILQSEKE